MTLNEWMLTVLRPLAGLGLLAILVAGTMLILYAERLP
jgi:hypothetical protein